jgi:hypothetical protein
VNSNGFRIINASSRLIEPNESNEPPELKEELLSLFRSNPYFYLRDKSFPKIRLL